jgi:ABC-type transport system substrate-binding protein/class 3 adenylate cyclase/streptogramin lyase/predicted Ser/Thr protein kinase
MSLRPQAGRSLAGYLVERLLGQGGMGAVYLARDERMGRRVALKVLPPELADDERFRERFLREWRIAAALEHPHVVPIYDAGEADGQLYIAMRYVEGSDLKELIGTGSPLEPTRALHVVSQVADALDAAHARGLVHRDVKPANVLLDESGNSYLCDFGLTKNVSSASGLTGTGQLVGTLEYIAPEAIRADPIDGRTDQYSLACLLFECLTGEAPFHREGEAQVLWAHMEEPPPRVSERRPELPKTLDRVLGVGMAKDPDARYPSCGELASAALAALSGLEPALPAGARAEGLLRAFVVADMRGYTRYTQLHGDEAAGGIAATFAALVDEVVREHGGVLQELRGDEALTVFESPRSALRAAVELQRRISAGELGLPVGIGLDAGEAVPVAGGYRGGALNLAARLCSLAGPGEVLASDGITHLARQTPGVRYGDRRLERLKGFDRPVPVIEVVPGETAPARRLGRKLKRALAGTRPRLRLALVAIALVLAAAAAAILASRGGEAAAETPAFDKGTVALLDAETLEPIGTFDTLGAPEGIWRVHDGQLWTYDLASRLAARIDPKSRRVTARIPLGINPNWDAVGAGSFWVGDYEAAAVNRYDPQYGTLTSRIELPTAGLEGDSERTDGMDFADGSLWVAYGSWPFRVARIDARTNRVTKTFDLPHADGIALVASGEGGLWVIGRDTGRMWRIDPQTNTVAATSKLHGGFVEDLAVARGYAWVAIENDRGVWKVDSSGSVLKTVETGDLPWSVSATEDRIWVPNANDGTITRIDRNDRTQTVHVGHRPLSAVEAGGLVWVSLQESAADAVQGLPPENTARFVVEGEPYFNTDPAVSFPGPQWQLQYAVGARLLRYPDREQPEGATLLPEISELPEVSADGRTYMFRIRPGFRFSPPSGKPVTAETMRYTLERALSPELEDFAQGFTFVSDIVGARAYHAGKADHVAGIRVDGDRLRITLVRPAPSFPARVSVGFFTAVPLGTPIFRHGIEQPLPSAGPYYLSSHIPGTQLVLRRNPNYHGPRPHRLEGIVIAGTVPVEDGAKRVERGQADYLFSERLPFPPDLAPGGSLDSRFGPESAAAGAGKQRYFLPQQSAIDWVRFNTRGIFRDARLRRAVNYALDRPALAAVTHAVPSDALLPPGIPGAGGEATYPLDGPDLARARALARGRGGAALLLHFSEQSCPRGVTCAQAAEIVKRDLAKIGIRVRTKAVDDLAETENPRARFDLLLIGWYVDFADPANFVNNLLDSGRPLGYGYPVGGSLYEDARYIERMRAAYLLEGDARANAYRDLVGDMMRESPPGAVYLTRAWPAQFFSERMDPACNVFRPQDGGYVDLAALCLRD